MSWNGACLLTSCPQEPTTRGRGMPHSPFRTVVNTLLYLLITGCRSCDTPRGPHWASKSAAHRWLQRWPADGTLAAMQAGSGAGPGTRDDSLGIWRRGWRLFPLGRAGVRASPVVAKARGSSSIVSRRAMACPWRIVPPRLMRMSAPRWCRSSRRSRCGQAPGAPPHTSQRPCHS